MRTLYHWWLDPFSRKVRLLLAEKGLEFDILVEKPWERRHEFLAMNPEGSVPVLVEDESTTICGGQVIAEFIEERYTRPNLLGASLEQRAETRRLIHWFDHKFYLEVTDNLLNEKVLKRFTDKGGPHSGAIRAGHHNIQTHLQYVEYLTERNNWLAGDDFSLADITAAAHLSAIDYIGDVPWRSFKEAKNWYAKVKSRPSFRSILSDHIPGMPPPRHYADLDF